MPTSATIYRVHAGNSSDSDIEHVVNPNEILSTVGYGAMETEEWVNSNPVMAAATAVALREERRETSSTAGVSPRVSCGHASRSLGAAVPATETSTTREMSASSAPVAAEARTSEVASQLLLRAVKETGSQAEPETVDKASDPRPPTPPPVRYDQAEQATPSTRNAKLQICPKTKDTAAWTGATPRPFLSMPAVQMRRLAQTQVSLGQQFPLLNLDRLADKVTSSTDVGDASQRRVVRVTATRG